MGFENYRTTPSESGPGNTGKWHQNLGEKGKGDDYLPLRRRLRTNENYTPRKGVEGKGIGFEAEEAIVNLFKGAPGIEDVRLASNIEDIHEGADVIIRFSHTPEELKCQISTNPDKTLADIKKGVLFIQLEKDEARLLVRGKTTPELRLKISKLVIEYLQRYRKDIFKSLADYYDV